MVRRTVFVFPGQGSQRSGMLASVPETDSLPRLLDAAEALSGLPLRSIEQSGDPARLSETRVAQPLLYLADWAWGTALMDAGIAPDALAGHSLGEMAALAIAGVYSVEAGLELVVERSRLMHEAAAHTPGTMAAVLGLAAADIAAVVEPIDGVWVANDNSAGQVVITGEHQAVADASTLLASAGARRVVPLDVAGPFHSPLMEPAARRFAEVLAQADFRDAVVPVAQNSAPTPATQADVIRERLMSQITAPVRWTETVLNFAAQGETLMIEAGPGQVLTGLAKRVEGVTPVSAEVAGIEAVLGEMG